MLDHTRWDLAKEFFGAVRVAISGAAFSFKALIARRIKISHPRPQEILQNPSPLGSGGIAYRVNGTLKHLPEGHQIWLLVEDQKSGVRPQGFCQVEFDPQMKTWSGKVNGYGASQLKIWAVVAPPTSQDFFRYYQKVGSQTDYEPLPHLPPECTNKDWVQARLP